MTRWPPDYQVRRSARAKNALLKIFARRGLEIILPIRYQLIEVPHLLNEKRSWIERHWHLLQSARELPSIDELPQQLHLACCDENWQINYLFSPVKSQIVLRPQKELTVLGDIDNKVACLSLLRHWLRQKAEQTLSPRFHLLSRELQLPFSRLTIRDQKTRWGSCSAQKSINLNFKLIFLAPELVRHIMIHELCHTVHLNHSRRFWQLVAQHDPQWRHNHHLSRRVEGQLPRWIDI